MSSVDEVVGMRIRHCRWKAGLRQEDIATRLGISLHEVRRYEAGESRISASRLFEIACLFNVPITHFFAGLSPGREEGGESGDDDPHGRDPQGEDHRAGSTDKTKGGTAETCGGLPRDPLGHEGAGPDDSRDERARRARGAGVSALDLSHPALDRATLQKRLFLYLDCLPQKEQEAVMAMLQAMAEARGCRADQR